jgi:hypothetical protein
MGVAFKYEVKGECTMENPEYIRLTKGPTFRRRKRYGFRVAFMSMLIFILTIMYFVNK